MFPTSEFGVRRSAFGVPSPRGTAVPPVFRPGSNALLFSCVQPSNVSARAEVTLNAFGTPFGHPNPRRAINWKHLEREYEMTRLITAADAHDNAWDIAVRPASRAKLEIELCGAMASPALTVGGRTLRFPVTLKAGERLLCRDGRHWAVLDSKRAIIAEGTLAEKVPVLATGTTRISFTCLAPDQAQVKLVKVYE